MAASLVSRDVSDLCIGKPPLRPLPLSATVAEVVIALRRSGEACLVVWEDLQHQPAGKVSMADVVAYLCSGKNIASPADALASSVSALLHDKPAGLVRRVEPHCSVLEALDIMLDGAQNLVVPIRSPATAAAGGAGPEFCWLTQEDFVRFFLNSISHFSRAPALSVAALGIIHTDVLSVHRRDPALSAALPLLELAAAEQTAVAVVTNDHRLVGEISPAAIAGCDETAAAALAALSAGELADFLRRGGGERAEAAVRARLREKRMEGMLELLEEGLVPAVSSSSSSMSSLSPSTSSDESESDEEGAAAARRWRRSSRAAGRRSEEMAVCQAGSSLVAVMIQALAHRVSHVWVVDGGDYGLAGVVAFPGMLGVFRDQLM